MKKIIEIINKKTIVIYRWFVGTNEIKRVVIVFNSERNEFNVRCIRNSTNIKDLVFVVDENDCATAIAVTVVADRYVVKMFKERVWNGLVKFAFVKAKNIIRKSVEYKKNIINIRSNRINIKLK